MNVKATPVPMLGTTHVLDSSTASSQRVELLKGKAEHLLPTLAASSVDCCITSPPYWSKRVYSGTSALGTESDWPAYIARLTSIFGEVKRVLKPTGSLWLNLGDTLYNKGWCGIPWRVAFSLQETGWVLRNAIVWDKVKGNPCHAKDRLRSVYEMVFHFVKRPRGYHYDVDAIRNPPKRAVLRNGRITTPTGVSGIKYERQIEASRHLSPVEKRAALTALSETIQRLAKGDLYDFRMIIRGCQRSTHSDSLEFSGRANELKAKGFCILPYHRNGTKPGDVWRIIPEDSWRKDGHYAVFPRDLCTLPIKATCPPGGIVLDPFVGTGTTCLAAVALGRRALGIDSSSTYLTEARRRLMEAGVTPNGFVLTRGRRRNGKGQGEPNS